MGRRGHPTEVSCKALDLIEAGRSVTNVARNLEISGQTGLHVAAAGPHRPRPEWGTSMSVAGVGRGPHDRFVDVVAQWVRMSWTKKSRGGPAAARRNAAPVGFVLPTLNCPAVHEVLMDEAHHFEPRHATREGPPDRASVGLKEADGRLRVELAVTPWSMPRRWRRPPAVWLQRGEWVRWQVNYRFSWPAARGGAWSYRLDTLNVAYGPTAADVFTRTPTRHVDERELLR